MGGFGGGGGGFGGGGIGFGVGSAGFDGDFSGTGLMIGMNAMENRAKGRKLDAMVNMLLAAILQGNVDMIESAMTIMNLKSKTTLIGAAAQTIRAMQLYDRNMKGISDQIGELAGKKQEDAGARLAGLNAEMNQVSMVRQAITNNLKDIMSMVEEMSTLEKSIYDVKSREAALYRWG